MAYIESFRVTNLAGRSGDISRDLDRHVNIFWGLNGAGKTTLLKILNAALSNETAGLDELPFDAAEVTFRSTLDDSTVTRTYAKHEQDALGEEDSGEPFLTGDGGIDGIWFEAEGTESEAHWESHTENSEMDPRRLSAKFTHSYLPITRVAERRRPQFRDPASNFRTQNPSSIEDMFVRQVRTRWTEYSAKSLARIRDIQQQGLASVLAILFGGIVGEQSLDVEEVEPEVAYDIVKSFLGDQQIQLALDKKAFSARFSASDEHRRVVIEIEEVRQHVAKILEPQREFQSVIDEMYAGNKHLVLRRTRAAMSPQPLSVWVGDKVIPLKSLSSGEKQLLQILLEALDAEEDTIMIDEPELSMHVDWQQRLVASLRRVNPNCQLLLATHSPEVMADVPNKLVFEL